MKIAISSSGQDIKGNVAEVFGRCAYFILAEIENKKIKATEAIENKDKDGMGGVGVLTAKLMAEKDVEAVITGNVGPRALDVLKQFKIESYSGQGAIEDAIQDFIAGKLNRINE